MIKLACKIPREVMIAVSGGPDSMALLHFCMHGKRRISVIHFTHGCSDFAYSSWNLVRDYCRLHNIGVMNFPLSPGKTEAEWSEKRREIYHQFPESVLTAHHLDDAVEWWMISAMRGSPLLTHTVSGNVLKPFLLTEKTELVSWCDRHRVPYLTDPTNVDGKSNARSKIRVAMPLLLEVNPGLRTTVKNLIIERDKNGQRNRTGNYEYVEEGS